jgi:hypothetical protein
VVTRASTELELAIVEAYKETTKTSSIKALPLELIISAPQILQKEGRFIIIIIKDTEFLVVTTTKWSVFLANCTNTHPVLILETDVLRSRG